MIQIDDDKKVDAHILVNLQEKHRRLQDNHMDALSRINDLTCEMLEYHLKYINQKLFNDKYRLLILVGTLIVGMLIGYVN